MAKRVENASLATISGHLKGGVRDPRHAGPVYIEVWPPGPWCLKASLSPTGQGLVVEYVFKPNGSNSSWL